MKQNHVIMLATAILISTSAITVNAVNGYHYDVNNDGNLNVIDIIELKKGVLNNETITSTCVTSGTPIVSNSSSSSVKKDGWSTILDDNTRLSVEENYKILAKEYIQNKVPSIYNDIQDMSTNLYNYDNLVVVTSTEPTIYSEVINGSIYYVDSSNRKYYSVMEDGATSYLDNVMATTRATATTKGVKNVYDACVVVVLSRNVSLEERDIFPTAWVENRNYINIFFKDGLVSKVS